MNYIHHKNSWSWGISDSIVAEDGKSIIYLSIENDRPNIAIISNLSVYEKERNKGRGEDMITEAERTAAETYGIHTIEIAAEIVWVANWYMRLGYKMNRYDKNDGLMVLLKNI